MMSRMASKATEKENVRLKKEVETLKRKLKQKERTIVDHKNFAESVLVSMQALAEESTAVIMGLSKNNKKILTKALEKHSCRILKIRALGKKAWGLEVSNY